MITLDVAVIRAEATRKLDSGEEMHPSQVIALLDAVNLLEKGCRDALEVAISRMAPATYYALLAEIEDLKATVRELRAQAVQS